MRYANKRHNFSIELPNGWRKERRKLLFIFTGGKVAFQSEDKRATINVSVGKLDRPEWSDQATRKSDMVTFITSAPGNYSSQDHGELGIKLGGEENTVAFWHRWSTGFGTIISAFHNDIEYVVQSNNSAYPAHHKDVESAVESFQFI